MVQLEPENEELALHLASGMTHTEAGRMVGLHRNTVCRRLTIPAFAARVRELRRAIAEQVSTKLTESAADAIAAMTLIATNGEDEGNRLKAADMILLHLLRFTERGDIEDRIRRLEDERDDQRGDAQTAGQDRAGAGQEPAAGP